MTNSICLSPQWQLRFADATKDRAILTELFCALRPDLMALPFPPEMMANFISQQQSIHEIGMREQCPDAQTMLLEHDGSVLASMSSGTQGQEIRLLALVVLPRARGQGLGRMLLTYLQQQAADFAGGISLRVFHHNPQARALYLANGFEIIGGDEISSEMRWVKPC